VGSPRGAPRWPVSRLRPPTRYHGPAPRHGATCANPAGRAQEPQPAYPEVPGCVLRRPWSWLPSGPGPVLTVLSKWRRARGFEREVSKRRRYKAPSEQGMRDLDSFLTRGARFSSVPNPHCAMRLCVPRAWGQE
jgi:hypothetical protein